MKRFKPRSQIVRSGAILLCCLLVAYALGQHFFKRNLVYVNFTSHPVELQVDGKRHLIPVRGWGKVSKYSLSNNWNCTLLRDSSQSETDLVERSVEGKLTIFEVN